MTEISEDKIQYEIEMRVIAFMTFIQVPLTSVTSVEIFNTFINKVEKPIYIEEKCKSIVYIALIHSLIEKYKNEELFYRFDKKELLKYKPLHKNKRTVS